jgi:hypothetical protein
MEEEYPVGKPLDACFATWLNTLSGAAEHPLRDGLSFNRFLALKHRENIPDRGMLWLIREKFAR